MNKENSLLNNLKVEMANKKMKGTLSIEDIDNMMFDCVETFKTMVKDTVSDTLEEKEVKKNAQYAVKKTNLKSTIHKKQF